MITSEGDSVDVAEIGSRIVSIELGSGTEIRGYLDEGPEASWNERVVVLAPRYGETKKNNLQLSYFLAANGFKVLRFDHTNHVGESSGDMVDFHLPGASEDILAVVGYVDQLFEPSEIILIAVSLSVRCGLRAAVSDPRVRRFVSLVGMVDLDKTLKSIYARDIFGEFEAGAEWHTIDILGFEIDPRNFYSKLVEANMQSLSGTLEDGAKCSIPSLFLHAEGDRWVDRKDVDRVVAAIPGARLEGIPTVGHEIYEQPAAVRMAFARILQFCQEGLAGVPASLCQPDKRALVAQNKTERERLRKLVQFTDSESSFWSDYLGKFGIIEKAHYYTEYFRRVIDSLGPVKADEVLLDAGCGNGFFGVMVLRDLLMQRRANGSHPVPLNYYAMDLSPRGLVHSYSRHQQELVELARESMVNTVGIHCSYSKFDFDALSNGSAKTLPFADAAIAKICSSLVISYLENPVALLKEFHRILTPGGVAVVSSMKPGCDMTVLYHDSVQTNYSETNDSDAKSLLSAAGKIKLKKDTGIYHFFTAEELNEAGELAGFKRMDTYRSFGDQANVVRLIK